MVRTEHDREDGQPAVGQFHRCFADDDRCEDGLITTPFDRVVEETACRQVCDAKRTEALARLERRTFDIEIILARGDCLSQYENDQRLVRDPQLYLKWTPVLPHPLPVGYELFDNERELSRLAVLPPEDRVLAAAACGQAWCVEELFARGCPIEGKHGSGFTALHVAATKNDILVVKVLLNMKVDLNAVNASGATPLSCAIGGTGGPDGECAHLLRAAGGLERLTDDIVRAGSIIDVPLRHPRRAIDDKAENLGRMVYTGQF